jgi:hypothetical protein
MQTGVAGAATQCHGAVDLTFRFAPQGTGAPLFVEGDSVGKSAGSYATIARTGVGAFTIKTADPYLALNQLGGEVMPATPGNWNIQWGAQTQNSDKTWTIAFTLLLAGTATDLAANAASSVCLWLRFRNSTVLP